MIQHLHKKFMNRAGWLGIYSVMYW